MAKTRFSPHRATPFATLLLFLAIFPNPKSWGQCGDLYFESFEVTGCPTTPCPHIDDNNCLDGWATSHGGAHISTQAASEGDRSLRIDFNYDPAIRQGAFLEYAFEAGNCYKISFRRAAGGFSNDGDEGLLQVLLANGLVFSGACAANSQPASSGEFLIHEEELVESSANIQSFQLITLEFTPAANYSQLWFRTGLLTSSDPDGARIFIDELTICCTENASVTAAFTHTLTYSGSSIQVEFEAQETGDVKHEWYIDDVLVSTQAGFTYEFEACQLYEIRHEVVSNCCVLSDSETIQLSTDWNDLSYDLELDDPGMTYLLSDLTGTTIPNNQWDDFTLFINGTLIIDEDYTFGDNGVISMAPGALIIIDNELEPITVKFTNCDIHGTCDTLWQGIQVRELHTLILSECQISDAEFAVRPFSRAIIDITRTDFDRNYTGLFYPGPDGSFYLFSFWGNTLTCTADLLAPYEGQATEPTSTSYAGVDLHYGPGEGPPASAPHIFGLLGTQANIFRGLRNGILAENASLVVVTSRFLNIEYDNGYDLSGYGIRAISESGAHSFTQRGLGTGFIFANLPTFLNCSHTGIYVRNMIVDDIRRNTMQAMQNGITVVSGQITAKVHHNDIEASTFGISLHQQAPDTWLDVYENDITISGEKGIGIVHNQFGIPPSDFGTRFIHENTVRLENHNLIGIALQNDSQTRVIGNTITIPDDSNQWSNYKGISLRNIQHGALCANIVEGSAVYDSINYGIFSATSESTWLSCNSVDKVRNGLFFTDFGAAMARVRGNEMDDYFHGLTITETGVVGEQVTRGNQWYGGVGTGNADARHESPIVNDVQKSRFYTNSQTTPLKPSVIETISPVTPGVWFLSSTNTDYSCPDEDPCDEFIPEEPLMPDTVYYDLDDRIALDSFASEVFPYELRWLARDYLFGKLELAPAFMASYPEADSFYQQALADEIGRFRALDSGLSELHSLGDSIYNAVSARHDSVMQILGTILEKDSIYHASGLPGWLSQRDSLQEVLAGIQHLDDSAWEAIWLDRANGAAALESDADVITTDSLYGENLQDVWLIYLEKFAAGKFDLDSIHLATLQDIAGQCPIVGGPGVYAARSILATVGIDSTYEDEHECAADFRSFQKGNPKKWEVQRLIVFPNPAANHLAFHIPWEGRSVIQVIDVLGNIRHSLEGEGTIYLDVNGLAAGYYSLVVSQNDQRAIAPFVIVRD
ncbi:MAG: T9SS type A sorting domain-containing protein [Saprospiraceae bacterium]